MARSFQLDAAHAQELAAVEALLEAASLPTDGISDQFPAAYVVARSGGVVIATAGLELHGPSALLRSVVVSSEARNRGVARALVENRMAWARRAGIQRVYLLTTTAAGYFRGLGFEPNRREDVSPELAASTEFARACPASATCLSRAP